MKLFLRVGVMHAGKLIDDRYLPETGNVTVGTGAENVFSLIGTSLPETRTLIHFEGHHPFLHVTDGMTGGLALDGKTREPLAKLQSKGKPVSAGEWAIQLPETARGWISLGNVTFFLQQVPKPPPPPKTTLPKEARTGFMSGLESMFVGVLVAVMSIEGIGVAAISRLPNIEPDSLGQPEDLDRFVEVKTEEEKPKPKEEKKEDDSKKKEEEEAKKDDKKEKTPQNAEQAKAERAAKVQEQAHKAVLDILGGGDGDGAFGRVVSNDGASLAGIDEAMQNARGGVAMLDDGIRGPRGGSGGGAQTIGDLAGAIGGGGGRGNAKVALGEKKGVAAPVEIENDLVEVPTANFSSAELIRAIKGRMGAVKSCYDRELKLDPNLKGKISMRFTITPLGRVNEVSVERDTMHSDAVSECIMRLIRTWTFSFKPDDEVSVSFPFVFTQSG
jgi:hypothetical protein